MPEFPGGNPAMTDFLEKNIHYPSYAMDNRIEGTLYISFIIEETGKISSVNVLRGIGGRCDEEAARAVNSMPDWSPAYLNGQPIRVRFNMPITFKLN
jgi:protein TonB